MYNETVSIMDFVHNQVKLKLKDESEIWVDEELESVLEILNNKGYKTTSSCQGDDIPLDKLKHFNDEKGDFEFYSPSICYIEFDDLVFPCVRFLSEDFPFKSPKYFIADRFVYPNTSIIRFRIEIKNYKTQLNLGDKRFKILESWVQSLPKHKK